VSPPSCSTVNCTAALRPSPNPHRSGRTSLQLVSNTVPRPSVWPARTTTRPRAATSVAPRSPVTIGGRTLLGASRANRCCDFLHTGTIPPTTPLPVQCDDHPR
jgi:hypothetical protein